MRPSPAAGPVGAGRAAWPCALAAALGRGDSHRPAKVVVLVSVQHDVYTDSRENNGLAGRACGAAALPSGVTMSETLSRPLRTCHVSSSLGSQCDTRNARVQLCAPGLAPCAGTGPKNARDGS